MEKTKTKLNKDEDKIIKEIISQFLNLLTIEGSFDFVREEDELEISMETKDTGIVIGYHGEILESLQLMLSLAISKKLGRFFRVSIEVGDYKKNRIEWLKNIAMSAKERAKQENTEITLPNLKSWERRIVHMFLEEDPEVTSESVGEGKERMLVIKPK